MKNKPLYPRTKRLLLLTGASLIWSFSLPACGIKTLPLPPSVYNPPAIRDLNGVCEAGMVTLDWLVPDGSRQRAAGLSGVAVFLADRSGSCPGCPPDFKAVATIPADRMRENDEGDLTGCHHLVMTGEGPFCFYVTAVSEAGPAGPKSEVIEIACPPEDRR